MQDGSQSLNRRAGKEGFARKFVNGKLVMFRAPRPSAASARFSMGGEIEALESGRSTSPIEAQFRDGTWYCSGRASLTALAQNLPAKRRLALPAYCCQSVVDAVLRSGLELDYYPVDEQLTPTDSAGGDAWLVRIHPFGRILSVEESEGQIDDYSMSWLSRWPSDWRSRPSFLSLRKFGGAPLGGWASLALPTATHPLADELISLSEQARALKLEYLRSNQPCSEPAESEYLQIFGRVENQLNYLPPDTEMPERARELWRKTDWESIAARRRENWHLLHEQLGDKVPGLWGRLVSQEVPLGYVLRVEGTRRDKLRAKLRQERVFCAVHWPLPATVSKLRFPVAHQLSETLLTLPIDQRYGPSEMTWLGDTVRRLWDEL